MKNVNIIRLECLNNDMKYSELERHIPAQSVKQ